MDWNRLEELFERARHVPEAQRAGWIDAETAGDRTQRDELASLLAVADLSMRHFARLTAMLQPVADDLAARLSAEAVRVRVRAALESSLEERYRIVGQLGDGGSAFVFLADDLRHGRTVAIKVPRPRIGGADPAASFLREIRLAAGLQHPNIVPVHDSGHVGEYVYMVMPHISGESLRARLRRERRLVLDSALAITTQVAAGLAYAHRHGIVHRDVKPANILFHEGTALVADFGIALALQEALEDPDPAGTPTYTSPEQLSGDPVDGRSDIYSLACVLHEMLSGDAPFAADGPADAMAALERLRAARPGIPGHVTDALARGLATRPQDRFDTVTDFAIAVVRIEDPGEVQRAVVVLPLDNETGDTSRDNLCNGLTEEVIHRLCQLHGLRVIGRATASRAHDGRSALTVGRSLGVDAVVAGSVQDAAPGVRLALRLIRCADGARLWSQRFDAPLHDVSALQDEVAETVARHLELELGRHHTTTRSRPVNRDAYGHFLEALASRNRGSPQDMLTAIERYERALAVDPDFVRPYIGIAEAYVMLGGPHGSRVLSPEVAFPRARAAIDRALEIDDRQPDAHAVRAMIRFAFEWDWNGAEQAFQRAFELGPSVGNTHLLHSWFRLYSGDMTSALEAASRAQLLDPLSPLPRHLEGTTLFLSGRYDESADVYERLLANDPEDYLAILGLCFIRIGQGQVTAAQAGLDRLVDAVGEDLPTLFIARGGIAGLRGDRASAERAIAGLAAAARSVYVPPSFNAFLHITLGDLDAGFAAMERAYEARDSVLFSFRIWPWPAFDRMRADPRWPPFQARLGLPAPADMAHETERPPARK